MVVPLTVSAQDMGHDDIDVTASDIQNFHRSQGQNYASLNLAEDAQTRQSTSPAKQSETHSIDKSKLRFGANLGLSISRNYTNLGIGPQVGYQLSNQIMAGVGIKYYYTKAKTLDYLIKDNLLGANIFSYYYPIRFIAFFIQPELNYTRSSITDKSNDQPIISKGFIPSVVTGMGLRLGFTHFTLNYDLIQHDRSPHPSGLYVGVSAFF